MKDVNALEIDATCIDAGTLPVSIDESHIEHACGVSAIDAACIDADGACSRVGCA